MGVLKNARWNMFTQFSKLFIQLVNVIYLAKIIPPSEYGLMAMALVVVNFGILLRDMGTSAALIQKKVLSESLINTVFWLNIIVGVSITCVTCLISPFIASIYIEPKLTTVLILLSITFPLSSCAAAHLALLERDSKFRTISVIEVSSSVIGMIIAILMAKNGYGVYSLVGQAVSINIISAIQFWRASKWRPSFVNMINFHDFKGIFAFSANLTLFNFINYFSRNTDNFIVGKYMSSSTLGCYNLAYRLMLFPIQSLTFVVNRSLYPVLSRYQDDNDLVLRDYLKCVFIILMIASPVMSGLSFYSLPFVNLVFGQKWVLTASILNWLAPTAIIQSVLSTTGSVFMAKGRTDILMKLGVLGTFLQVGSFLIGVNYTIQTFAMCYFIANLINFFPVMYFLLNNINGNLMLFFSKIKSVLLSTSIMLIFLFYINTLVPRESINSLFQLSLCSLMGAIVYIGCLIIFSSDIRSFLSRKIIQKK